MKRTASMKMQEQVIELHVGKSTLPVSHNAPSILGVYWQQIITPSYEIWVHPVELASS